MLNRIELRTEPCGLLLKTFLQTDMDQVLLGMVTQLVLNPLRYTITQSMILHVFHRNVIRERDRTVIRKRQECLVCSYKYEMIV